MNISAVIYNSIGRILRTISGPQQFLSAQLQAGEQILFIEGSDRLHYVDINTNPHTLVNRIAQTITTVPLNRTIRNTGSDNLVISGINTESEIQIIVPEGATSIAPIILPPLQTSITFNSTFEGNYIIQIIKWPFLITSVDVTVTT